MINLETLWTDMLWISKVKLGEVVCRELECERCPIGDECANISFESDDDNPQKVLKVKLAEWAMKEAK